MTRRHRGGEQPLNLCRRAACGEEVAQVERGRTRCLTIFGGERGFIGMPCASQITLFL